MENKYVWVSKDKNGDTFFFEEKPVRCSCEWISHSGFVELMSLEQTTLVEFLLGKNLEWEMNPIKIGILEENI